MNIVVAKNFAKRLMHTGQTMSDYICGYEWESKWQRPHQCVMERGHSGNHECFTLVRRGKICHATHEQDKQ